MLKEGTGLDPISSAQAFKNLPIEEYSSSKKLLIYQIYQERVLIQFPTRLI